MAFKLPKHTPPSVRDDYERNCQLNPAIVKLGQQLQNAAFALRPDKQCPPDECPAPIYMSIAVAVASDKARRKLMLSAIALLPLGD
jgi:hypothetical protein